jgi:DNA-binding IclR family transcriptional regulator
MVRDDAPGRLIKTADTVFDILDMLREEGKADLSTVAETQNLAKSTVHDHLATLRSKDIVVKEGDEYRLSLNFLDYGIFVREAFTPATIVDKSLEHLGETTDGFARFFVEEYNRAMCVGEYKGERGVYTSVREGEDFPLHCLAAGKVLLSYLPESQRERVLEEELEQFTDNTITDSDELREELATIREREYALSDSELIDGVRAVASPVQTNDRIYGSISIAGPTNWMHEERFREELPAMVLETSNEVELKIEYGDEYRGGP